ncbi:MAG: hypothetical protein WD598_17755 [Acidimicrobiia bacterium]
MARLARLHAEWVARHVDDVPVPPADLKDGSLHAVDLGASPAVEAEFQRAAEDIFARESNGLSAMDLSADAQMDTGSFAGLDRSWTTLWDRPNRRVLILAGRGHEERHWKFVARDSHDSVEGVYDIWRADDGERGEPVGHADRGEIVLVEVHLDENDTPLGFPDQLLDRSLLGSMTIWPYPEMASFIWWFDAG